MIPEKTVRYELSDINTGQAFMPGVVKLFGVFNRDMMDDLHVTRIEIEFEPDMIATVHVTYAEFNGDETEKVLANPSLKLICESEGQKVIQGWLRMLRDDWYRLKDDHKRATQGT